MTALQVLQVQGPSAELGIGPLEVLEVDILWPRWVARIGVTRSTQAKKNLCRTGVFADGRPSVHGVAPLSDTLRHPASLAPLGAGGVAVAVSLLWEREI